MNRLKAVTDVRKRTSHNDRHCVVEVRALHLRLEVNLLHVAVVHNELLVPRCFLVDFVVCWSLIVCHDFPLLILRRKRLVKSEIP